MTSRTISMTILKVAEYWCAGGYYLLAVLHGPLVGGTARERGRIPGRASRVGEMECLATEQSIRIVDDGLQDSCLPTSWNQEELTSSTYDVRLCSLIVEPPSRMV